MKNALVIAAVVALAATSAHASKARVSALGNARHLNDIRYVLTKPDKAVAYGEWATLEFGAAGATPNAEAGFVRMMGQSALGAFLGNGSANTDSYRTLGNAIAGGGTPFLMQENPLRVFYASKADGDLSWGLGFLYSSSKDKASSTSESKQDTMGLSLSASTDVWDVQLQQGLTGKATNDTAGVESNVTGKSTTALSGGYKMDTMYIYGNYEMGGATGEQGSTTHFDRSDSMMKVGVVNSHKTEGTDFFYGIEYSMTTKKEGATNPHANSLGTDVEQQDITALPIFVGIEAEATSWMVLRGSFAQDFGLLGLAKTKTTNKNSAADTERVSAANSTVSAGVGIKWNKFTLDALAAARTDGNLTTGGAAKSDFLTNASLTYVF